MNRKQILKSPRFVLFGANLTQFEVKYDIRAFRGHLTKRVVGGDLGSVRLKQYLGNHPLGCETI